MARSKNTPRVAFEDDGTAEKSFQTFRFVLSRIISLIVNVWFLLEHHKTGALVWHPLQDDDGTLFYLDAEAVLARLPRRGIPVILREIKTRSGVAFKLYSYSGFEKIMQQLRKKIDGVPSHFSLDACRHGA